MEKKKEKQKMLSFVFVVVALFLQVAHSTKVAPSSKWSIPKEYLTTVPTDKYVRSNTTTAGSNTYLMYAIYYGSMSCNQANLDTSEGIRFGSCISGSMYTDAFQDETSVYFNYNQFTSEDCSGTPYHVQYGVVPKTCIRDHMNSVSYAIMDTPTPWTVFNKPGFVAERFYNSIDDCTSSGTVGDMLFFTPLNFCHVLQNTQQGNVGSEMVTACANGKRTVNSYSDYGCEHKITTTEAPLSKCGKYGTTAFETDVCA